MDSKQQILQVEGGDGFQRHPPVKTLKLHFLCFCLGMFFMQIGWVISGQNQTKDVMQVKLGVDDDDEWTTKNAIISSSSVLGMSIGAFIAGSIVANGRRKFLIIFGIIGIIGTAITLITNLYIIVLGRFIHGLCTGVFMTGGPRFLDETVPSHLLGTFGTYTNVYANLGLLVVMSLGLGLPAAPQDENNVEEMAKFKLENSDDQFWRVIYGFPIISLSIGVSLLLIVFRQDSIGFNVMKEEKEAAVEMIAHIYQGDNSQHVKIYEEIKSNTKIESSKVTFKQALFDPEYRKATWICFLLALFNQNTGLNAIFMYSNTMIKNLSKPGCQETKAGCFFISPINATVVLGVIGFLSALVGPFVIGSMKRKNNILYGHGAMGITMILMAILKVEQVNVFLFICICLYAFVYQTSLGANIWMYSNEVTVDSAGGLIVIGVFGMLFIQSLCLQQLMDSSLQPEGVFGIFAGITVLGFFYVLFFIKDTHNLSDKEKKALYNGSVAQRYEKMESFKESNIEHANV